MNDKHALMVVDPETGETEQLPSALDLVARLKGMDNLSIAALVDRLQSVNSEVRAALGAAKNELAVRMEAEGATALPLDGYEVTLKPPTPERVYATGLLELENVLADKGLEVPVTADGKRAFTVEVRGNWTLLKGLLKYGGRIKEIIEGNTLVKRSGEPELNVKRVW